MIHLVLLIIAVVIISYLYREISRIDLQNDSPITIKLNENDNRPKASE